MAMTTAELTRALGGLFAYDMGSRGSGIHDEDLRERAIAALEVLDRRQLATLLREMWLSDEAIEAGYGAEDLMEFAGWLDEQLTQWYVTA